MIVTPDCVDADPVRERLRARGYVEATDDMGFGSLGEVWIGQGSPADVQTFLYCSDRSKFLAQCVIEAGI